MFTCDYKTLTISFNNFFEANGDNLPEYGCFCLLELKNGRYTAGEWCPNNDCSKTNPTGSFVRDTGDSVDWSEVAKWHRLSRYDITECLEDENIGFINMIPEEESTYHVDFEGFNSFSDKNYPKNEQYCLLLLNDGSISAGRWDKYSETDGTFIHAPALCCIDPDKVWAWKALSPDDIFEREEAEEKERLREEELNKKPTKSKKLFKYGTDINVYSEKALEKLKAEYPWASIAQMKKCTPWEITPVHGRLVFGQTRSGWKNERIVDEWKEGSTSDEFIDYLCEYTKPTVANSNPEEKFKFGTDIKVYTDKAYKKVKKNYHWLTKEMLKKAWKYDIRQIDGDYEFIRQSSDSDTFYIENFSTAEDFIKCIEYDYENCALSNNGVIASYDVPFGHVDIHGWNLEQYRVYKLATGDYKVSVTAGNRSTGGSRDFFITPDCFKAKTYDEFLDRYQKIVPGSSFGLYKSDLLPDKKLKKFFGY